MGFLSEWPGAFAPRARQERRIQPRPGGGIVVCVRPRVEEVVPLAERALPYWKPAQIQLTPDCGFGCFANRCVNDAETAGRKLDAMVAAARVLRGRHG